jgi:hypothetical protein
MKEEVSVGIEKEIFNKNHQYHSPVLRLKEKKRTANSNSRNRKNKKKT